jgi:nitroreductase
MEFEKVVESRRSVRDYDTAKKISDGQLKKLFELVKMTPSGYNMQHWEFIVVRNPERKEKLSDAAKSQRHVREASAVVIALGSKDLLPRAGMIADDRIKKGSMDEARKAVYLSNIKNASQDTLKMWAIQNTSLAVMTLVLAAKNMGISSCIIGAFDIEKVRKEFRIPQEYEIVLLVTLGYDDAKPSPEQGMRFGFNEIVHLEEFGKKP